LERHELVNWMNQVDATYRAEFRELFEVHFARFDAKLEQRVAQLDAKVEQRITELKADVRGELAAVKTELLRWNFLFWIGTLGTVVALMKL
jgi:hypothetical protein